MTTTDKCCSCPSASNRCRTDECPCFLSGKTCQNDCETGEKYRSDCLNRPVCRCSCLPGPVGGSPGGSKVGTIRSGEPILVPSHCDSSRCECYRYREPCSSQCGCKGIGCSHTATTEHLYQKSKQERPVKGCKCGSGKRGCTKPKCSCRSTLEHCTKGCRCRADCANARQTPLTRPVKSAFLFPEQEPTAMIARLMGHNGLLYQMEFINMDKNLIHGAEVFYETILNVVATFHIPILHLNVYLSRSPCFHQDCDTRCEVLQQCESQKACARLLSVAFGQIKKHINSTEMQMTVRFLSPYVKRGDLYTQQGILNMMEAGIHVEPLNLKEWIDLLEDPPHQGTQVLLQHWSENNMETLVRQSQHYINACRRTIGYTQTFWTSGFHDLLKTTVMTCATTQQRLIEISKRLTQQQETEAMLAALKSGEHSTSSDYLLSDGETIYQETLQQDPLLWSGNVPEGVDNAYEDICNMKPSLGDRMISSTTMEALNFSPAHSKGKTVPRKKKSKSVQRSMTGGSLSSILHRNKSRGSSPAKLPVPDVSLDEMTPTQEPVLGNGFPGTELSPEMVEQIVLNFSGRSIGEQERKEMRLELDSAVHLLQDKIGGLLHFLEQKSHAKPS